MFKKIRKYKNSKRRSGAVSVEFAFVLPVFFLMVFGSIEFARVYMIQSAVENACFEGARRGIVPGATSEICKARTEEFLELAGVKDYVVTVEPSVIDIVLAKEIVVSTEVTLTASNGFGISGFFKGRSMVKSVSLPTPQ